jgi:hypothetical protein
MYLSWLILAALLFGWALFRMIKIRNKNKNINKNIINTNNETTISGGGTQEFCSKCGAKLVTNTQFCRMCGTKIQVTPSEKAR